MHTRRAEDNVLVECVEIVLAEHKIHAEGREGRVAVAELGPGKSSYASKTYRLDEDTLAQVQMLKENNPDDVFRCNDIRWYRDR